MSSQVFPDRRVFWGVSGMVWRTAFVVLSAISWPCLALISTSNVEESGIMARLLGDKFGVAAGGLIKFDVNLKDSTSR